MRIKGPRPAPGLEYLVDVESSIDSCLKHHAGVDRDRTLAENVADVVGLRVAYAALRASPQPAAPPGTFSSDQLFFLGFAQAACQRSDEFNEAILLLVDTHAPPRARVNLAVTQMPEFAAAFGCAAQAPMNPDKRCDLW
jgi:predicted metalloendopeptidase